MSRQFRHRTAGWALVALFAVAPLLGTSPAHAGQTGDGARQVVFGGSDVFGLSCHAQPDVPALMVPAESTVQVVNDTGRGAELLLDGRSQGAIPENGSAPVVFRRGTVSLALEPDCLVERESAPVLVTIAPSAPPSPTVGPPSSSPSPSATPSGTVDPFPSQPKPTTPTVTVSVGVPHGSPTPSRPTVTRTPRDTRTPGADRPDSRPRSTADAVPTSSAPRRTDGSRRRSWMVTDPPATPSSSATTTSPPPSRDAVPVPGVPPVESPTSEPAAASVEASVEPAAEAMADLRPLTRTGGTGLLALMATVCVTGVMAGAVRTIAAQRASRANMA